jgi:UDP-2,3-diacylglucosamine hydrolase
VSTASPSPAPASAPPASTAAASSCTLQAPVFISDLHLSAAQPATLAAFLAWVGGLAGTGELVILGDLFEFWAGDDALGGVEADDVIAGQVADALAACVARGRSVWLMHGNRDVLLGEGFLARSGARLLADPCLAQIGGGSTPACTALLAHGDAYCTADTAYQQFRLKARNPAFQAGFLAQPLAARRALLGQARAQSESVKQALAMEIMDVTPGAIEAAFEQSGAQVLVHGHTHRPGVHVLDQRQPPARRMVLTDWDLAAQPPRGGGLAWDGQALVPFAV